MKNIYLKTVFAALLLLCSTVASAEEATINGITYNLVTKAKTAEVIAGSNKYTGDITIPESVEYNGVIYSVTTIGNWAFSSCTSLTSVTIPNSVKTIGSYAFTYCTGLTSVTIGNSVTTIGDYAFYNCSGLTSVTIPNSVTTIGSWTFYGCTGLTSVTIGNSVTMIGSSTFYGCTGLTSVTIPNSVTTIDASAFRDCTGLTSVTIPNSVRTIICDAFSNCTGLTSVTIGNNVTTIGGHAFYYCTGLTSVTIPNSVTTIGYQAFSYCGNLLDVYCLATTAPSTYDDAFEDSYPENATLHVPAEAINSYRTTEPWSSFGTIVAIDEEATINGITYNLDTKAKTAEVIAHGYGYAGDITIPESVEYNGVIYSVATIGEQAFYNCYNLTSVTIPNSVTTIGNDAFSYCTGLTSVTIGNSVTTIDPGAFYGCYNLTSINIPNSVTTIGGHAFQCCSGLTSVTIGNSVTTIDSCAFDGCSSLTSINIPNSVTTIGEYAFGVCSGLTSIVVDEDNSVYDSREGSNTLIETASNTLILGCKNSIIPSSVTTIGSYAFSYCTGLTSVTIPNSVTTINYGAFSNCGNILDVYCLATTVPSTETHAFEYSYPGCATLHVPAEAINSYRTTEPWSSFGTIVAIGDVTTETEKIKSTPMLISGNGGLFTISSAAEGTVVSVYTASGILAGEGTITNGSATVETGIEKGETVIISAGGKSVKVIAQ